MSNIQKYCKTLDVKYIKRLPPKELQEVKEIVNLLYKKYKERVKNKTALFLLYNHFNNLEKLPVTSYIEGLLHLTEMKSEKYGLHIYLMGEGHTLNTSCFEKEKKSMKVLDYLKLLLSNSDKFIDIFAERKNKEFKRWTLRGHLSDWMESSCKYQNDYTNYRCHYTDYRDIFQKGNFGVIEYFLNKKLSSNKIIQELEGYQLKLPKKPTESHLKKIFKIEVYKKQLKKLPKELQKKIKLTTRHLVEHHQLERWDRPKVLRKLREIQKETKNSDEFRKKALTLFEKQESEYSSFFMIYMDLYLILRLFRPKFNEGVKGIRKYYPREIRNVIIYAGAGHTEEYERWLMDIGDFEVVSKNKNMGWLCTDVRRLKQPLFQEDGKYIKESKPKVIKPTEPKPTEPKPTEPKITEPKPKVPKPKKEKPKIYGYTKTEMENMSLTELRKLCKKHTISNCWSSKGEKQTKQQVIKRIISTTK